VKFNPPKSYDGKSVPSVENMKDDETSEPLYQRADDTAEALVNRLQQYSESTVPILAHYQNECIIARVNANQSIDEVWAECEQACGRVIVILTGPPGAGKGTHSPNIVKKLQCPSLSTGDMLRAAVSAGSEVGKLAKAAMDSGALVTDEIVVGIIKDRITEGDCEHGFILDGFPRTLDQAKQLDEMLTKTGNKVTRVVEFKVPDPVLTERICGRWIHKNSGRSYHVKFAAPKSYDGKADPSVENMKDDETGEPLMQRGDDTAEALVTRLEAYHTQTEPIMAHYAGCAGCSSSCVDANQEIGAVWSGCLQALGY